MIYKEIFFFRKMFIVTEYAALKIGNTKGVLANSEDPDRMPNRATLTLQETRVIHDYMNRP